MRYLSTEQSKYSNCTVNLGQSGYPDILKAGQTQMTWRKCDLDDPTRFQPWLLTICINHLLLDLLSIQEAPPLMPALAGRYHIKWTQLADLPAPLCYVHLAVQHHKIYVTGYGDGAVKDAPHQVYIYNVNTDQWGQFPPSGHYLGIPHIIGGRLAIIGGRLSATKKRTNKVSTFDEDSQTWTSYYPDLLSVRSKPGVVSHLEHVIVAGGARSTTEDDDTQVVLDDIEVLNWIENSHWRKVSIKLPVPMYNFTPTISDDHLLIVGYSDANTRYNGAYKIPVANFTASIDQQHNSDTPTKWTELTVADHKWTALVPSSSPPVVVGGQDNTGTIPTADIKMYDNSMKSWKMIGSLSFARTEMGVAAVYNNAIVVIGGCTKGNTIASSTSSSLTVVELGQAELLH